MCRRTRESSPTECGCTGKRCTNSQCENGQCTTPKRLANLDGGSASDQKLNNLIALFTSSSLFSLSMIRNTPRRTAGGTNPLRFLDPLKHLFPYNRSLLSKFHDTISIFNLGCVVQQSTVPSFNNIFPLISPNIINQHVQSLVQLMSQNNCKVSIYQSSVIYKTMQVFIIPLLHNILSSNI